MQNSSLLVHMEVTRPASGEGTKPSKSDLWIPQRSPNLHNLMTAIYSTLGTTWKFQVSYSCSISTPNEESVCYTCSCVGESACVPNPILHTCGYFAMFWQVLALTSLLKWKRGKNKTEALSFQSSWQWCSAKTVLSLIGFYQNLKCFAWRTQTCT